MHAVSTWDYVLDASTKVRYSEQVNAFSDTTGLEVARRRWLEEDRLAYLARQQLQAWREAE
jgi:hypothetical protein